MIHEVKMRHYSAWDQALEVIAKYCTVVLLGKIERDTSCLDETYPGTVTSARLKRVCS